MTKTWKYFELTFALHGRGRPERRPQLLCAGVAAGRHVEGDLHELVALHDHRRRLAVPGLLDRRRRRVLVGLAALALAGVQNLRQR